MPRRIPAAARPDSIRQHNLSLLLRQIHRDGALTRAELTQRLKVSRSTVGTLVADLTDLGVLQEIVPNGSPGAAVGVGRPSHLVGPRAGGPYAVGVDIDIARVTVASVGLGGDVVVRRVIEVAADRTSPAALVRRVARVIGALAEAHPERAWPCGVGVSVPGTVDRDSGTVEFAPNLGWHGVRLAELLATAVPTGVPVAVGNDADLAVLAEFRRGSARECDDVVFLLGRIGVGAGIIVGGTPLHGRKGYAGEIGHNVLDPAGPPCHCGQRGCIETYLGDAALLGPTERGVRRWLDVPELLASAGGGNRTAVRTLRAAIEPLGRTIAMLLNTLDPERVVLGGTIGGILDLERSAVEESVERFTFGTERAGVELVLPGLGADSSLLGAAEIAFAPLLADPAGRVGR